MSEPANREKLLTPHEVAAWLGVSVAWVTGHAAKRNKPYLPTVRLGKLIRFREADIEQFIKDQGLYEYHR
jgi:excisionase family DNA binding protein